MFDLEDSLKPPLLVGERVVWLGDLGAISGFVRWLGKLPQNATDWTVGVEFDTSIGSKGMNGKLGDRQLFNCKPQHGILLPIAELIKEEDFFYGTTTNKCLKKGPTSSKYASLEFSWRKRSKQANAQSQHSKEQQSLLNSDATTVRNILLGSDWFNKKKDVPTQDGIRFEALGPQSSLLVPSHDDDVWIRQDSSQQNPYIDLEPSLADSDFSFSENDLRVGSKKQRGFSIFRWLKRNKDQSLQQRTASLDRASGKNSSASIESTTSSFAYLTVSQEDSPGGLGKKNQPNGMALCRNGLTKEIKGVQRKAQAALPSPYIEDDDDDEDDDSDGAPYERIRFGNPRSNEKPKLESIAQQNRRLPDTHSKSQENHLNADEQLRHRNADEAFRRRASRSESPSSDGRKRRAPLPPRPQRKHTHARSESLPGMKSNGAFLHVPGKRPAPAPPSRRKNEAITMPRVNTPDRSPQMGSRKKYQAPQPPDSPQKLEASARILPTIADENEVVQDPIYSNDSLKLEQGMLRPTKDSFSASSLERDNKNPLSPKLWYKRRTNKKSQNRSGQVFEDDALPWLPETTPARSKVNVLALTGRSELTLLQASFLQEPGANVSCAVTTRTYEEPLYERVAGGERNNDKKSKSNNILSMLANISGLDREAAELLKAHGAAKLKETKSDSLEADKSAQARKSTYDNYNIKEIEDGAQDLAEHVSQKPPNRLLRCDSNDNNEAMSSNLALNDLDKGRASPSSCTKKLLGLDKPSERESPRAFGSAAKAISLFNDISSHHPNKSEFGLGSDTEVPSVVNDLHNYLCDVEKDMMTPPMKKKARVERNKSVDNYFKNFGSSLNESDKTGLIRRSESLANELDATENVNQIRSVKEEIDRLNEKRDPLIAPVTSMKWEQEMKKYFKDKEHHKIQNKMPSDAENSPLNRRKERSHQGDPLEDRDFKNQQIKNKFDVEDLKRDYDLNLNNEASFCKFDKSGDISCRVIRGSKTNGKSKIKTSDEASGNSSGSPTTHVNHSLLETNSGAKTSIQQLVPEFQAIKKMASMDTKSDSAGATGLLQETSAPSASGASQEKSMITQVDASEAFKAPEKISSGTAAEKNNSEEAQRSGDHDPNPLDLDEVRKARLRFFESIEAQKEGNQDKSLGAISKKTARNISPKQDPPRKGISVANITITATNRDVKVCTNSSREDGSNLRNDTKVYAPGSFLDNGRQDEKLATSRRTPERYATKEEATLDQATAVIPASTNGVAAEDILACSPTEENISSAAPTTTASEGVMTPGGIYSVIMKKKSGELTDALPPSKELSSLNQYAEQYLRSTESLYPQVSLSSHHYPSTPPRTKRTHVAKPTYSWCHSSSSSPVPKTVSPIPISITTASKVVPLPRGRSPIPTDQSPVSSTRSPMLDNVTVPPRGRSSVSREVRPLPKTPSSPQSNRSPKAAVRSRLPKYVPAAVRPKHSGSSSTFSSEELLISGMSEAASPELPKRPAAASRFVSETTDDDLDTAPRLVQRYSAEEPLLKYQGASVDHNDALQQNLNYQYSPPLPKKKGSRKSSLESGVRREDLRKYKASRGRAETLDNDQSPFFPPQLPKKKYSISDENRPPTLPKKGSLNTGIDLMALWQTEYFRKKQDIKDELIDLQNAGVLLDLKQPYVSQNKDLPAPCPYPRHRYANQKSRMRQKQRAEQNQRTSASDFFSKMLPRSKSSHKKDTFASKTQSLDRWGQYEPPESGLLHNGNFELLEAKDFAELEALRTGVKPKSPMPFPRSSRRKDVSTNTTLKTKGRTDSEQWNTLAINKLLRQLEAAIQVGEHQQAAELAQQLAQLKIRCSVVKESKKSEENKKSFKVNIYLEDKSNSKGSIPLTVSAGMTVKELKQRVNEEYGLPSPVQRWVLGHQLATNEQLTLENYGVNAPDSPLFLYLVAPDKADFDDTRQEKESPKNDRIRYTEPDENPIIAKNKRLTEEVAERIERYKREHGRMMGTENEQVMEPTKAVGKEPENVTNIRTEPTDDNVKVINVNERTLPEVNTDVEVNLNNINTEKKEENHVIPTVIRTEEQPPKVNNREEGLEEEDDKRHVVNDNEKVKVEEVVEEDEYVVEENDKIGWSCGTCTLVNHGGRPGCEACGDARPENYSPVPIPGSKSPTPAVTKTPEYLDVSTLSGNYRELVQLDQQEFIPSLEDFECPICFVPTNAGEGAMLKNCLHTFCKECLAQTIEHSDDPEVQCPFRNDEYACDAPLQDREIRALVPQEAYQRLMARSMAKAESRMENTFHCKSPDCTGWCQFEDEVNLFHCPVCDKDNCLTCQAIHMGLNCRQYQEQLVAEAPDNEDARKTRNALDELVERGEALRCPQCGVIILKKWGCDWVRCSFCKTEICWVTKGPRWGPGGKGDTSGGCKCGLKGVKCHPKCTYCH